MSSFFNVIIVRRLAIVSITKFRRREDIFNFEPAPSQFISRCVYRLKMSSVSNTDIDMLTSANNNSCLWFKIIVADKMPFYAVRKFRSKQWFARLEN